jgi:hypothetical protein
VILAAKNAKDAKKMETIDNEDREYLREIIGAAASSLDFERMSEVARELSLYCGNGVEFTDDEEDHFPE